MSTQYLSSSTMRWIPCTCPSMRRSLPSALPFVSASIIVVVTSCVGDVSRRLPLQEHPPDPVAGQGGGQMLERVTAHDATEGEDAGVEQLEQLASPSSATTVPRS